MDTTTREERERIRRQNKRDYMRMYMRSRREMERGHPSYTRGPYKTKNNETEVVHCILQRRNS